MSKINKITFDQTENTAWENNCDGSIDFFPNYTGSLTYIIERIKECGADVIHVQDEGKTNIPVEKRIKQICKKCGYTAVDKSHTERRRSGIIKNGEFEIFDEWVYEFELIKNN